MPYFPTYQETLDAMEHARLKMWHEHGKVVEFGGPEFTLYLMEGLGKMEAPKILDEPLSGEAPQGSIDQGMEGVGEPTKTTVTKSFGIEGEVRAPASEGTADEPTHEFISNRNGKRCLDCGEGPEAPTHG